jgi:hypothetical protein
MQSGEEAWAWLSFCDFWVSAERRHVLQDAAGKLHVCALCAQIWCSQLGVLVTSLSLVQSHKVKCLLVLGRQSEQVP